MFRSYGLAGIAVLIAVVLGAIPVFASHASAGPNICVSTNGVERHQAGSAVCESFVGGNVAIAKGEETQAYAGPGRHNHALAIGDFNEVQASFGQHNTARAIGHFSVAESGNGEDPTGDRNTATVKGDDSYAGAYGENNTATVRGDGSTAEALADNGCTAEAIGDGAFDSCS